MTSVASQLVGQQIGRYLIRAYLGGGGVATVYRALDQVTGHEVALKLLPPNPELATLSRFRREALLAGALRHPHIVRILQVGTTEKTPAAYIAMDLVEGERLAALLARVGQLRAAESCRLLEPVARALAFAHGQDVVHRDVKPSNILLRPFDSARDDAAAATVVMLDALAMPVVPVLSDFGIARFLDAPELTGEGRTVGTPAFMAPEQCMGSREVDGRADIYALGAVLYRCLTGRLPFNGSTTQILHAHVFEPVVIDDEMMRRLPPKVIEVMRRALAKSPDERYPRAQELAADLADAGGYAPTPSTESSSIESRSTELELPGAATLVMTPPITSASTTVPSATPSPTSTMMMAQAPAVAAPANRTMQVLVPGTTHDQRTVPSPPPARKSTARRGPSMERVMWAGFFLALIVGGSLWSASTWLRARSAREETQTALPAFVMVTFTPTPMNGTPELDAAAGLLASTATATAVVTLVVSPTVTIVPTTAPMGVASSVAADAPTPVVQERIKATPTPVPPSRPVPSPTVVAPPVANDEAGVGEEGAGEAVVGTCAMVVDERLLASVAQLAGNYRRDFSCPTAPARVVVAAWLPFARGMMVTVEGEPLVYVYYEDGSWEQVAGASGDLPADAPERELPTNRLALAPPFAHVLATQGRHLLLGDPMQTEPWRGETVVQPFVGGVALGYVALGSIGDGQVLFLARAKLRF